MKLIAQRSVFAFFWVVATFLTISANAADSPDVNAKTPAADSPYLVVKTTTDDMLAVIKESKSTFEKEPKKFYSKLMMVLEPVVAFDVIARRVMTRYTKQASDEQIKQFTEVFKTSMIEFYGKALLKYDNNKIEVDKVKAASLRRKSVPVNMTIETVSGAEFPLTYTMFKDKKSGQWKMRNVIVGGQNVGNLFKGAFVQAMKDKKGNLQQVIDNWSDIMSSTQVKGKS